MKRNFTYLFLLFAAAFVISCSKGDDSATLVGASPVSSEVLDPLLIDAAKTELNDTDAAQVMKLFLCRENPDPMTRASFVDKTVDETFPITGDNGETLAYVVNYAGGGYGIVSATKKYAPILAFSDEGRLSAQSLDGNGIALWVASITADIAETKATLAEDSPEYADTRLQWREYEQPEPVSAAVSTMQDANYWYQQIRSQMMNTIGFCTRDLSNYQAKAIRYYGAVLPDFFPRLFAELQEMDRVLAIRYGPSNPPPSFIWGEGLMKQDDTKIMPLLGTYWHQFKPYNDQNPLKESDPSEHQPAGCVTIAVAQILNYYRYPERIKRVFLPLGIPIDWSQTQEKFASYDNQEIPKLVRAVNIGVVTKNGDNSSSSNIDNAQAFLKLNGYGAYIHSGPEVDWIMRGEIKQGRPVYVQGANPNTGKGHAWVCDGYYSYNSYYRILAYKLTNTVQQHFAQNPYTKYQEDTREVHSSEFLHMNWGWQNGVDETDPSTLREETIGWYRSVFNNKPGYCDDIRIIQIIKE